MSLICPCNTSQQSSKVAVLRHVKGNVIEMLIPLTRVYDVVTNGVLKQSETGFPIHDVVVNFIKIGSGEVFGFKPSIQNVNVARIVDKGTLPLGTYSIEVSFVGIDNNPYRYKQNTILKIVDTTEDGCSYETDEFDVKAYYAVIKGRSSGITITDDAVIIQEGAGYKGDDTPNDNYADIIAEYGTSSLQITSDEVIIKL